jgi:hypothetical protein
VVVTHSGNVSVLLNDGHAVMAEAASHPVGFGAADLATADFDGDGHLDVAIEKPDKVSVLLNRGDATFRALVNTPVDLSVGIAIADFNGDRKPDVAVSSGRAMIGILLHV